ncbi:MAG: M16 family metallopeptidase [Phycisphaerales bacterium]
MRTAHSEHRLANGLTIIAEVDPAAHTMAAGYFVRTGGRDEPRGLMGVSHFLEHMMFKGSASVQAQDVNRRFDDIGAEHNAFTTIDMTAYHAHVLPDRQDQAIALLSDLLRPALRDSDFDEERKVILEEIAMYDDNPFWPLYERASEVFHGDNPLGHRVLGTPESIKAMDVQGMRDYFRARYSPDNTVLALAGRVDLDAAIRVAEAELGHVPPQSPRDLRTPSGHRRTDFTIESAKATRHYLLGLAPGPSARDEDRYAFMVLCQVLSDADSGRLHWALVEPGLADSADVSLDMHDDCGDVLVSATCDPEDGAEVESILVRELERIVEGAADDELAAVRAKVATMVTLAGERPSGRMRRLGGNWAHGLPYRSLAEELRQIESVTAADTRRVAQRFPLVPWVTGRTRPAPA